MLGIDTPRLRARDLRQRQVVVGRVHLLSVIRRHEEGGHAAIGFGDDPEHGLVADFVRGEEAGAFAKGQVVGGPILGTDQTPVAGGVTSRGLEGFVSGDGPAGKAVAAGLLGAVPKLFLGARHPTAVGYWKRCKSLRKSGVPTRN